MVQALAPRLSRGCTWVWLTIVALALASPSAWAQTDPTKAAKKDAPSAKKDEAKPTAGDDDADAGVVSTEQSKKRETTELFKDPRVDKTRPNTFAELRYPNPRLTDRDIAAVQSMAGGQASPDRALIVRLVDTMVADLTNHANIKAVVENDPKLNPNSATVRAIERASSTLLRLYDSARANKNEGFLAVYLPVLTPKLQSLLDNHLLARIEAAILLAMTAGPNSVDFFTRQINDPNQIVWVKLWSARGITNATNGGRTVIDVVKGSAAAAALVGFLGKEPEAPWPVKVRIFEALGALRLASTGGPQGKPDVPATALRFLADRSARPETRAWAAWAIGMIPIPTSTGQYNFGLEAYQIGRLAADLGEKIGAEYDAHAANFVRESDYARLLTGLLLYQVYPALAGEEALRDSGLLNTRHPAMAAAQPLARGLDEQIKNVGRAAIDLLNAGGTQTKEMRGVLGNRVTELNSFLAKNTPTDVQLTPGGPKYPVLPDRVAGGTAVPK